MRPCTLRIASAGIDIKATSLDADPVEHAPWCRTAPAALPIRIKPLTPVHGVRTAVGIVVVAICLAVLAGGCGEDEPKRSALAENLAQLCEQARADTEALGLPGEKGFVVMKPTAEIGLQLAKDVKKLRGTTAAEKEQVASLAEYLRFYYAELAAAVKLYSVGQTEVYGITMNRAKGTLESAEALGTRMGAPECAVRAFPDR